jgi:hypothetical protein
VKKITCIGLCFLLCFPSVFVCFSFYVLFYNLQKNVTTEFPSPTSSDDDEDEEDEAVDYAKIRQEGLWGPPSKFY